MAATFAPPHPVPVFRVLKQAWRDYLASGNAAALTVSTPPNQVVAATTVVSGTLEIDPRSGVPMPASVSVQLRNGTTVKATQNATVDPATGAFTTTFPVSTLAAGAANAVVTRAIPYKTLTTPNFTVTCDVYRADLLDFDADLAGYVRLDALARDKRSALSVGVDGDVVSALFIARLGRFRGAGQGMKDAAQQLVREYNIARYEAVLKRLIAITEAETSMLAFTRLMMPDPNNPADPDFTRYNAQRFHEVIAAALEELEAGRIRRLIIKVPPRHGKTEIASKKYTAWFAGRHPELSIIFGTYNEKFSQDIGRAVRDILLSPAYAQVFPKTILKTDSKSSERLETTEGGILAFVGRGGTTTGRGGDLLIIDDP